MLRIALPNKGRLSAGSRELLAEAGLPASSAGDRALTASLGGEFEALFLRAQDIPEFVADGAADAGITGLDLVRESGLAVDTLLDLGFGACRLVVAVRDDRNWKSVCQIPVGSRVATAFPRLTQEYFRSVGVAVDLVSISGAAEVAPHLGIADVIVDLTSSGSTLRMNGLRPIATVLESSAHLVSRSDHPEARRPAGLAELADALRSVVLARGQRYLMANMPRGVLAELRDIMPGLNGPTVVDVLDGGRFVAVHAVVPAGSIYRTIARLKALGGEGILVTRIERLTA
jgi:ATP phosphoribosyltransferase